MPASVGRKGSVPAAMEAKKGAEKLGVVSGVYIPVCLSILSILMFLRFGIILGQIGLVGMLGLIFLAYCVDLLTTLSLSAIASNGEVKGGGAYYLISRSLGPEFGGSIGVLFFLAQVLNAAMNIVGLIDCIRLHAGPSFPQGFWMRYGLESAALLFCACLCLLGSATFSKASNGLLVVLSLAIISIPVSALFNQPFRDESRSVEFTGFSLTTLAYNFFPNIRDSSFRGLDTFRDLFGVLFSATSGIFAGASMSGDLKNPSKAIPKGTLWAMLTTFLIYVVVVSCLAATTTRASLLANSDIIGLTSLYKPVILAGECAVTFFSALMGITGAAKLFQVLARDRLLPGLAWFGKGTRKGDDPLLAILLTYVLAQFSLFADLNQIATLISMGYLMTFFVMNLACFLLKIGSAPNFRPSFKFFNWQTAGLGSVLSAVAMFFMDETYAATAICVLVFLFLLIHYLSPPKHWGDVSQNLIYHQVRKYLLRLKPEHIKFWRPQIVLLINDPRKQTRLIQFCNSLKKGSLYILGHVIVTDDFSAGAQEARLQQHAWTNYISESSRIKAFVQLTMSPSINWGIRNLILSAGLGGMRPNIAVMGFYNMNELRGSHPSMRVPEIPTSPTAARMHRPIGKSEARPQTRRRGDTSARLLEGVLPTDVIRTEGMMSPTEYMTALEDLALIYRLNVAVGYGFDKLETPAKDGSNSKKYIDLWPIQMSAEVSADGKNVLTTNFDTYTLILQLGHILHSVRTWERAFKLRVMVFVEYESEVDEEHARVKALLEKLRIDAEVVVSWLSSGRLNTYELIINGIGNDIDWEIIVNDTLKNEEWWDDLQMFRGRPENMTPGREIEHVSHIIDSTVGRSGVFNPHQEGGHDRRRHSMVERRELFGKSSMAFLGKAGVNMGIHTHHLNDVLHDSSSEDELGDTDSEKSEMDEVALEYNISRSLNNATGTPPDRQPLLSSRFSRRSLSYNSQTPEVTPSLAETDEFGVVGSASTIKPSYGTITGRRTSYGRAGESHSATGNSWQRVPRITEAAPSPGSKASAGSNGELGAAEEFPKLSTPEDSGGAYAQDRTRSRSLSKDPRSRPSADSDTSQSQLGKVPAHHSSNLSVQQTPDLLSVETPGTSFNFGYSNNDINDAEASKSNRPSFSRQSSLGRFSSRPMPETKVHVEDDQLRTISFAEQPDHNPRSAAHSRHHSRHGSQRSTFGTGDASLTIPELLESYKLDATTGEPVDGGSAYSTQGIALSFNDLPSRAQHLIINELLRQNSRDTAVVLTTLPIPSEGTNLDEIASIQYLSDVEVLCNELPPTLMVLSNNMTVTVSL